jgi:hypothetical protein
MFKIQNKILALIILLGLYMSVEVTDPEMQGRGSFVGC